MREVAGAVVAFERAQQLPHTIVSIATAGWLTTARLKLSSAGFEIRDVAIATSNDAPAKADVMRISADATDDLRRAEHDVAGDAVLWQLGDVEARHVLGQPWCGACPGPGLADDNSGW